MDAREIAKELGRRRARTDEESKDGEEPFWDSGGEDGDDWLPVAAVRGRERNFLMASRYSRWIE